MEDMDKIYENYNGLYYLFRKERIIAVFVPEEGSGEKDHYIAGNIYEVVSWYMDGSISDVHFFCRFSIKHDGCSHFWFLGEDSDGKEVDNDAYYHVCGASSFVSHMRLMSFAYELKVTKIGLSTYNDAEKKEYEELKELNLLKGYTIVVKES